MTGYKSLFFLVFRVSLIDKKGVDIMTKMKACQILGVCSISSPEKIKEAYCRLSKKYFPDSYEKKGVEEQEYAKAKFQEITEAYHFLMPKNEDVYTEEDFYFYREKKASLLTDLIEYGEVSLDKKQYMWFYKDLEDLFVSIKVDIWSILNSCSREEIDQLVFSSKRKILAFYYCVSEKYIDQNYIPSFLVERYPIDYDCNVNSFAKQLEALFQKSENIWDDMEQELMRFRVYAGYDAVKDRIEKIARRYQKQILVNRSKRARLIQQMSQEIEFLFSHYFDQKIKLEKFMQMSLNSMSVDERNKINSLQEKLGTYWFEREYEAFQSCCPKLIYFARQEDTKLLYSHLQKRVFQELERLSFATELNRISVIKEIEKYLLLIFDRAKMGMIAYDKLQELTKLTFVDFEFDFQILRKFRPVLTEKDIYVQKNLKEEMELDQTRWVVQEYGDFYLYSFCPGSVHAFPKIKYLNRSDILAEHIPILEFFKSLKPFFHSTNHGDILYTGCDFDQQLNYCVLDNDNVISNQLLSFNDIEIGESFADKKSSNFGKKENLIQQIVKQVNFWADEQTKCDFSNLLIRSRRKN